MKRSHEPLVWFPFSAGMMVDAMAVPALVVVTGVLVPLGLVSEEGLFTLLSHFLGRAFVFVVVALSLFHAAHRLRFTLIDLGLKRLGPLLAFLFYGGAVAGTAVAAAAALGVGGVCGKLLGLCCGP